MVEDDKDLNRQIAQALEQSGYAVDRAFDGEEGQFLGDTEAYDAVVLDIGLPKRDGITILESWRAGGRAMPVLILTARDRWSEKVQGFDAGADDYVAKPYEPRELLARCKSVLRRSVNKATPSRLERVKMGGHMLDLSKRQLLDRENGDVPLTSGEFDILKTFAENPNRPLSRDWLLETTSHRARDPFDRAIDLRITRIRRKIEPAPDMPTVIRTVRGVGYMFVPPAE